MSRLLLLLSQKQNQQLLSDELSSTYEVQIASGPSALEGEFDLCIVDAPSLDENWERIGARKTREQPIFLPILLVTSRPGVKMITRHVWRSIDELIISPIEKPELRARLEILLRVRVLTLMLRDRVEEATKASETAMEANRAKSEFLANMSHELRTPINAITGYTELLQMGLSGPVTQKQEADLRRIRFSADHLLNLVNEVLNLAKVESGQLDVEVERAELATTVGEALDLVTPQALGQEIRLDNKVGDGELAYWGDHDRVRQVLVNILSNAVRFTEAGGTVTVSCRKAAEPDRSARVTGEGPWLAVDVTDTGIGIPAEKLQTIFDPFVQVDSGTTRSRGGTGLGLTISQRLIRLMGGDLTVRSEMGVGSCFTLWLVDASAGDRRRPERIDWSQGGKAAIPGLAEVGHALVRSADDIVRELGDHLRLESWIPGAATMDRAQLEDHTATFLADIGRALVALEGSDGGQTLIRDGSEIQRTISQLHGAQRARLGWPREAITREFEILRGVAEARLRREMGMDPEPADPVGQAMGVLGRLFDQAEQISSRAWVHAQG